MQALTILLFPFWHAVWRTVFPKGSWASTGAPAVVTLTVNTKSTCLEGSGEWGVGSGEWEVGSGQDDSTLVTGQVEI